MNTGNTEGFEDRAARACRETVAALQGSGVQPEHLAELVPASRRLLVFPKPATMHPIGRVWRLGALLLDTDAGLWAAGRATRAAERGRVGYQSLSREERLDIAAAALRGGFAVGAAVNFDAHRLELDAQALGDLGTDAPVGVAGDELRVRWRAGAPLDGAPTLAQYLRERSELLINPPLGAT